MKTQTKKANNKLGCPQIQKFKIGRLHAAAYNPRVISDEALGGLAMSIKRFGCVEPIIVNIAGGRNIIVGGHQRFKALRAAGVEDCICVTVELSEADEKLLNVTLNNPHIQGKFIEDIGRYIENLQTEIDCPQDILDLRIELLRGQLEENEKHGNIPDDQIPEPPEEAQTRRGNLWLMGEHRLLCGDSTKSADVDKLMEGRKAGLFATDPPYCVDYTGADRPGKNGGKIGKDWSGVYHEVDIKDSNRFLKSFLQEGLRVVHKNTAIYLWHASRRIHEIEHVCAELSILIHQQIIWVKPCVVLTYSFYSWRHEPCLLMWKKGYKPPFRPQDKKTGSVWIYGFDRTGDPTSPEYYTDVWELDWDGKKRKPGDIQHPTVKPVEVFAIPMRVHTRPGDICYEPFSGSGTQIIAAEKLGRRCYAMEIEPVFCDVAVKRWEEWTGRKAKRVPANNKKSGGRA